MREQVLKVCFSIRQFGINVKEKVASTIKSNFGDVNYPLTVAMFSVIILVFGYPIWKSIVTTIFGDIQTWWNSNGSKIFDEVVK